MSDDFEAQIRQVADDSKPRLMVIREAEWATLYNLVQKASGIIGKLEEKVANHDALLNNPTNGVVSRISELEKSLSEKFHKIELEMTKQLSEIKANEDSRYTNLRENHAKELTIQQEKFIDKLEDISKTLTEHFDELDARITPLEEKKVANWASWQTLVIVAVVIVEILNLLFNYFQGAHQHIGTTTPAVTHIVSYLNSLFC